MVTKKQLEFFKAHPDALNRFCDAIAERATVGDLETAIQKLSNSLREQLSFVDGKEMFDGLDFQNDTFFYEDIQAIATVETDPLVLDRQRNLP